MKIPPGPACASSEEVLGVCPRGCGQQGGGARRGTQELHLRGETEGQAKGEAVLPGSLDQTTLGWGGWGTTLIPPPCPALYFNSESLS